MKKLKSALSPSWLRIITSLLLFVFVPVFPVKFIFMDADPQVYYLSVLRLLTSGMEYRPFELWPQVMVFVPIFALAAIYMIVAILAWKIHWADLICSFGKFLKPDKAKVIITAIGMSILLDYVLMYIAGCYGGLMGLPDSLYRIYSTYHNYYVQLIALPVTFISFLFYHISSFIIVGVSLIAFARGLDISNPYQLANYGIVVTIVIYAMIIVEWYLFACAAVTVYRKIKG